MGRDKLIPFQISIVTFSKGFFFSIYFVWFSSVKNFLYCFSQPLCHFIFCILCSELLTDTFIEKFQTNSASELLRRLQ